MKNNRIVTKAQQVFILEMIDATRGQPNADGQAMAESIEAAMSDEAVYQHFCNMPAGVPEFNHHLEQLQLRGFLKLCN
jgi:hypothetical protein